MALRILDFRMASDHSRHTARLVPGTQYSWEVSWLPGRHLNRNEAITAMVLADTTAYGDVQPGHRSWPQIEGWADELGMTGSQVLDRVAGPPRWAKHQEMTADSPDADPDMELPDVDPLDLGWTDDFDWPEPDYPDPSWRGWGYAARRRPMHLSDRAVSDWHKERHPDKSANLRHALPAGPQPDPELDKSADWEAGQ